MMKRSLSVGALLWLVSGGWAAFAALDLPHEPLPQPPTETTTKQPAKPKPASDRAASGRTVVLGLQDGSRVVGQMAEQKLTLASEAIGHVEVPWENIRLVSFTGTNLVGTVALANGDKLRGTILTKQWKLTTVFGVITIPLTIVREIQVPPAVGEAGVEWEPTPFPSNSDWPGPRGVATRMTGEEIILNGQRARTKASYQLPVTIEYEFKLDDRDRNDGALWLEIIPADTPATDMAERALRLAAGYDSRDRAGSRLTLSQRSQLRDTREIWRNPQFVLETGHWMRIRWELTDRGCRVTVNDDAVEGPEFRMPAAKFRLEFFGWQPGNTWRVRNVTIR
jgi:hypothetical protein